MDGTAMDESPAQHMRALEHANRVRLARSRLKRRIATGELDVAEVIRTCPDEVKRMQVSDLLLLQRRWGGKRCVRFLKGVQVPEAKEVGRLTRLQRQALLEALTAADGRDVAESTPLWPAWAA